MELEIHKENFKRLLEYVKKTDTFLEQSKSEITEMDMELESLRFEVAGKESELQTLRESLDSVNACLLELERNTCTEDESQHTNTLLQSLLSSVEESEINPMLGDELKKKIHENPGESYPQFEGAVGGHPVGGLLPTGTFPTEERGLSQKTKMFLSKVWGSPLEYPKIRKVGKGCTYSPRSRAFREDYSTNVEFPPSYNPPRPLGLFADEQKTNSPSPRSKKHKLSIKIMKISERCMGCKIWIQPGTTILKCKFCKQCLHVKCKENTSRACMASSFILPMSPSFPKKKYQLISSSQVPQALVECIMEIDRRAQCFPDELYNDSFDYEESTTLLNMLQKKINWSKIKHVESICETVLYLIGSLSEPVLPKKWWNSFAKAVGAQEKLREEIWKLPEASRDTLAFLIVHIQKVRNRAKSEEQKKLLVSKFSPGIIGIFGPDQSPQAKMSYRIMNELLDIPSDFWLSCFKPPNRH